MQWTFCNPKDIFWNRVVGVVIWNSQIGGRQDYAEVINKIEMKL